MWFIELPDGTEYELSVAHGIALRGVQGNGMPPVGVITSEYGLADGALYHRTKTGVRVLTFILDAVGDSWSDLHAVRAALIEASNPHRGVLPVRIWYRADTTEGHGLYLDAYYEAGLEGGKVNGFVEESIALRFLAVDPFWKYETPTTAALGVREVIAEAYNILSLDRDTGVWAPLIEDATPDVYLDNTANAALYASSAPGSGAPGVIVGGAFTSEVGVFQFTESSWWFPVDPNAAVYAIAGTPDDTAYFFGGAFSDVGYLRIIKVSLVPPVGITALGTGLDDTCYAIWTPDGSKVIAGGAFANAGGSAAAKIAVWSGAAWAAVGAGMNGNVYAIKGYKRTSSPPDGDYGYDVFVGGAFTTGDGVTLNRIGKLSAGWDTFTALGAGMNGTVYALEIRPNGWVYAGGAFTTAGGKTVNRVARWNGSAWFALGQGFADGEVHSLWWDAENLTLYAGGTFTRTTEGYPIPGGVAKWQNGRWVDASEGKLTAGGHDIKAITGASDRLIIAGAIDGEWVSSAKTTITNAGTARAYPTITITGPGRLYYLKNNTTGQSLYFDYELVPDEVVTLDFSPGVKTITSSWRGNILYAITGGSMVNWYLAPGANDVTCWVDHASATATYSFTPTYWSNDGAVPTP